MGTERFVEKQYAIRAIQGMITGLMAKSLQEAIAGFMSRKKLVCPAICISLLA